MNLLKHVVEGYCPVNDEFDSQSEHSCIRKIYDALRVAIAKSDDQSSLLCFPKSSIKVISTTRRRDGVCSIKHAKAENLRCAHFLNILQQLISFLNLANYQKLLRSVQTECGRGKSKVCGEIRKKMSKVKIFSRGTEKG